MTIQYMTLVRVSFHQPSLYFDLQWFSHMTLTQQLYQHFLRLSMLMFRFERAFAKRSQKNIFPVMPAAHERPV